MDKRIRQMEAKQYVGTGIAIPANFILKDIVLSESGGVISFTFIMHREIPLQPCIGCALIDLSHGEVDVSGVIEYKCNDCSSIADDGITLHAIVRTEDKIVLDLEWVHSQYNQTFVVYISCYK